MKATTTSDTEYQMPQGRVRGSALPLWRPRTSHDSLDEANIEWKHYFHDVPWEILLRSMWKNTSLPRIKGMKQFYKDAQDGTLPAFSWIDPQLAIGGGNEGSNDQPVGFLQSTVSD